MLRHYGFGRSSVPKMLAGQQGIFPWHFLWLVKALTLAARDTIGFQADL